MRTCKLSLACLRFICLFYSSFSLVLYDNLPTPLPVNVVSNGFAANSITQMGNYVILNTSSPSLCLSSAIFGISAQTAHSDFPSYNATTNSTLNNLGWLWNITALFYAVNVDNSSYVTHGNLLYSQTNQFFIPWRPEHTSNCSGYSYYSLIDDKCHSGVAVELTFDFPAGVALNTRGVIAGLSWNTLQSGFDPVGYNGPWTSMNIGLATTDPSAGMNGIEGTEFVNSTDPNAYNTAGPTGIYRIDYEWSPYTILLKLVSGTCPTTTTSSLVNVPPDAGVGSIPEAGVGSIPKNGTVTLLLEIILPIVGGILILFAIIAFFSGIAEARSKKRKHRRKREKNPL
jgi:hypothetical protein